MHMRPALVLFYVAQLHNTSLNRTRYIGASRLVASVGRVSAPTHSPKAAPLSDSMLIPQFAGSHPCLTYRWKLEYGQWLTCATYPCFTGFQWM